MATYGKDIRLLLMMHKIHSRMRMLTRSAFLTSHPTRLQVLSQEESISELVRTGKSLVRFGDGEATIMEGGHLYFQRNELDLMRKMRRLMTTYSDDSRYLIALPPQVMQVNGAVHLSARETQMWRKSEYIFSTFLPKSELPPILDAMIFREDSTLNNSRIAELWSGYNTIYFIHSNYKYFVDFQKLAVRQEVLFINILGANAYSNTARVLKDISRSIEMDGREKSSCIALVSAGPAGKVIVNELADSGVRALDCGHYFDYKFYNIRR